MDSWENIILQWINCLHDSSNVIKTIEELQDGKIYYTLINRIIPWSSKKSNKSQKDIVLHFLKEEYPNFPFRKENSAISKLCIASLVLSRLSLEPIFHKMCINLDVDVQIKIKSILETVYSLDKTITDEDLHNIFLSSSKNNLKLLDTEPKFISDEFIETSELVDNLQSEQTKQIRQLKVQIETMGYEKSDLEADIEAQNRQIKDLQSKLQEALAELKMVQADNFKFNSNFMETKDKKDVAPVSCQEDNILKKYIYKLQTENIQLQDQNKALVTQVKQLYLEKQQELKERNENMKKAIELAALTKSQEKQIKDLQSKLQESLRVNSPKFNNSTSSVKVNYRNAPENGYQFKVKSLEAVMLIKSQEREIKDLQNKLTGSEKHIAKLKPKNYQLVQEKRALTDELKLYKGKHHVNPKQKK